MNHRLLRVNAGLCSFSYERKIGQTPVQTQHKGYQNNVYGHFFNDVIFGQVFAQFHSTSQQLFTYSKSTLETPEQCVKSSNYFTTNTKDSETTFIPSKQMHFQNQRNTRKRCEICSKLTKKIPERCG